MEIESRLLFQALKQSQSKLKLIGFRTSVFFSTTCCLVSVHSSELDFKRAEILKEVQETIKDSDLAAQIVELRLRREAAMHSPKADELAAAKIEVIRFPRQAFEVSTSTADTTLHKNNVIRYPRVIEAPTESATNKTSSAKVQASTSVASTSYSTANNAAYVGIGNRLKIGYSQKLNDSISLRTEISGINKTDASKVVDETRYQFQQKDLSLGAYADWFPSSSFRISAGISLNRMHTTLKGIPNSNVNINGSHVNLGSDTFDVEFRFPKVTPYVGLGFGNRHDGGVGFQFYGDLGLLIGKYDAITTTSLVGSQNVQASDIESETNRLRKSLYKWAFIPTATIGLTYRFN